MFLPWDLRFAICDLQLEEQSVALNRKSEIPRGIFAILTLTTNVVQANLTTRVVKGDTVRPGIGRAELELLTYVQDHHPVTVREVAQHFARTRGHVRTTTLNVMGRLVRKKYLTRRKSNGVFHYRPRVGKGELLRGLVREFVERALGGSPSPFVAYLAEDAQLSAQDVAELRRLIGQLERRNGSTRR